MAKFQVEVIKKETLYASVDIDAESEGEARAKAELIITGGNIEFGDAKIDDVYVAEVVLVRP